MPKLSLFTFIFALFLLFPSTSNAAIEDWQKGFNLRLNHQSTENIDQSLQQLKDIGATYVSISPGWLTTNTTSSNVDRKWGTPTDDHVIYTINKAHSLGLKVMLKPHLDISNGIWRANLDPEDKASFFENYNEMIMTYAGIANATNTEQLSVGAELVKLTVNPDNTPEWEDIISNVRGIYSGSLTYSANADKYWNLDELRRLTFWDRLDYAGISFYRPMASVNNPTPEELLVEWQKWENEYLLPATSSITKPIIFSEIGYRSFDGAAKTPWDFMVTSDVDQQEQKDLYHAFFEFWKDKDYIHGVNFWEWEPVTSINVVTNTNYTPQFKISQELIEGYFKNNTYAPITIDGLISTMNRYTLSEALVGSRFYRDRMYKLLNLPAKLNGQELIQTVNFDKYQSGDNFLSFNLIMESYVYVAYDSRAVTLPTWLNEFTKTEYDISTDDATFNIYQRKYAKGEVVLGGNLSSPAQGAKSNYFVIVSLNNLNNSNEVEEDIETGSPEISLPEIPAVEPTVIPSPTPTPTPTPQVEQNPTTDEVEIILVDPEETEIMNGEKKIKIMIKGMDLDTYTATYNVENQGEIKMPNDATSRYKQSKVDFDEWDWAENNKYEVEITARNLQGFVIGRQSFDIEVKE
ncbi:MAG: hypothetical protein QG570_254 [Patescibacteria group bacterium]|nr:hypothetical protein [Patescibacteria group bacterium]